MNVLLQMFLAYWPYLTIGLLALAIIALAFMLLKDWKAGQALDGSKKLLKSRLFTKTGFFYTTLFVFMLVSVGESGDFFNTAITHNAIYGTLGYAVAVGFDLLSYVCMVARLNASRIYDRRGVGLSLLGVVVCASVSAFANVASAIQGYNPASYSQVPVWMRGVAPWSGIVFPAMIVIVSLIADHLGDGLLEGKSDADAYRTKENKKLDLLRVRLDIMKDTAVLHQKMAIEQAKIKYSTGTQREWFFTQWIRPIAPINSEQMLAIVAQTITPLQEQIEQRNTAIETLQSQLYEAEQRSNAIQKLLETHNVFSADIETLQSRLRDIEDESLEAKRRKQARKYEDSKPIAATKQEPEKNLLPSSNALREPVTGLEENCFPLNEYSVTEVMAAEMLNVPVRTIARLLNADELSNAPNNSPKITVKSIKKYADKKGITLQWRNDTGEIPATISNESMPIESMNGYSNGHSQDTDAINMPVFEASLR